MSELLYNRFVLNKYLIFAYLYFRHLWFGHIRVDFLIDEQYFLCHIFFKLCVKCCHCVAKVRKKNERAVYLSIFQTKANINCVILKEVLPFGHNDLILNMPTRLWLCASMCCAPCRRWDGKDAICKCFQSLFSLSGAGI